MKYRFRLPENYRGVVKQIIRPTGLLDPIVEVRPSLPETFLPLVKSIKKAGLDLPILAESYWDSPQVVDLMKEIEIRIKKKQRVLVTTLTKRMAEELCDYLISQNIKAKYLHSEIGTVERVEILTTLRKGEYDVLVGINLLREGLDLPEVSLIAILDADKEGFLRSATSLIQIIGRAARHAEGTVIMYADSITESMRTAIVETQERRKIQYEYNQKNKITPKSIIKAINSQLEGSQDSQNTNESNNESEIAKKVETFKLLSKQDQKRFKKELEMQMQIYADMMEFEKAAYIRDLLRSLK